MVNKQKTKRKETAADIRAKSRELRGVFHAAGLRLTKQRLTIYQELESCSDHPDVDYLFRAVKRVVPKISLFTVYRTMNVLEASGLVWRVTTWKSHARYGAGIDGPAHFLCEKCGRIKNVEVGDIGFLRRKVEKEHGHVNRMSLIFHGTGTCCATRAKRPQFARARA